MAIKMECSKERGLELGVTPIQYDGREIYLETSWVGCVLSIGENHGYNDSDFYAMVWDAAQGRAIRIEYATTRGWTYANSATVDATPEVLAAFAAWEESNRIKAIADYEAEKAKMPQLGRQVRVIGGRKLAKGTIGEVVWFGKDAFKEQRAKRYSSGWECILPFRYYPEEYRVGIRLINGERVFVSDEHIEMVKE